jgi:hypothetical protein
MCAKNAYLCLVSQRSVLDNCDECSRQCMKASAAKLDMHISVAGIWVCRSNEAEKKCVYKLSETPLENYWACFGLYPSSCMWKKKIPQRFGDWICLRPQVDGAGLVIETSSF